jgi:hypothetical protein
MPDHHPCLVVAWLRPFIITTRFLLIITTRFGIMLLIFDIKAINNRLTEFSTVVKVVNALHLFLWEKHIRSRIKMGYIF